jgi:uncharacterized membrane protein YhhN
MQRSLFLWLFWIDALAELIGIAAGWSTVQLVAKPLLMVFLLLYFLASSPGFPAWRKWVIGALVCSWAGDVLLMSDDLFIPGLASFLIAHLFYIATYQQTGARTGKLRTVDGVKFVLVGCALIWVLYPGLGSMLVPVIVYAVVLMAMAIQAHRRRGATPDFSFTLVAAGAVLFVLSDALIAVQKFAFDVPYDRLLVMSTYIVAQFLIVEGLLRHQTSNS